MVTGIGAVSPLGPDWPSTWAALLAGRCAATLLDDPDLSARVVARCSAFEPVAAVGVRDARHTDRSSQLARVAAREARTAAGLTTTGARVGVVLGSGLGGLGMMAAADEMVAARGPSRVSPFTSPGVIANAAAALVALDARATGPSLCPVTACATGTDAVGLAGDILRLGRADVVLAGGTDAPLVRALLAGLGTARATSRRHDDPATASRPFDAGRDGFVPAEGACVLVLETWEHARSRGAAVLAELVGYGAATDAHHMTAPRPDGAAAEAAVRRALSEAGLDPADVDLVSPHATSTPEGDAVEARVLERLLAAGTPVSASKSMTGHLMGAAGALEAALCVQALVDGRVPPTISTTHPETDLDLVLGHARALEAEVALSTGFGFGGHDAAIVLRRDRG